MDENVALKYWSSPLRDHLPADIKRAMLASLLTANHIDIVAYTRYMRDWSL